MEPNRGRDNLVFSVIVVWCRWKAQGRTWATFSTKSDKFGDFLYFFVSLLYLSSSVILRLIEVKLMHHTLSRHLRFVCNSDLSVLSLLQHLLKLLIVFIVGISSWLTSRSGHEIWGQLSDGSAGPLQQHNFKWYKLAFAWFPTFTHREIIMLTWLLNLVHPAALCEITNTWLNVKYEEAFTV